MYFCYLDESGTPEASAQTSHFVLLGIAIPATAWHRKDGLLNKIKRQYGIGESEIHTGYIARRYLEQERIPGFEAMDPPARRLAVKAERKKEMKKAAALKTDGKFKALKKLYSKTDDYIHLDLSQRQQLLRSLADEIGRWHDARLFADAVDKRKAAPGTDIFATAFEQVVTRFHHFLRIRESNRSPARGETFAPGRKSADNLGLLIEDNNITVAKRITGLMRRFHLHGTLWTRIDRIIETPLFVDSTLTSMVQVADLCAYATRRFFENSETDLFERILPRFDKSKKRVVGIRHYTGAQLCQCQICNAHGRT